MTYYGLNYKCQRVGTFLRQMRGEGEKVFGVFCYGLGGHCKMTYREDARLS